MCVDHRLKTPKSRSGVLEQKLFFHVLFLCFRYVHDYPHLSSSVWSKPSSGFFPEYLYKGVLYMDPNNNDGMNNMFYIGGGRAMHKNYSWSMYDIQALWAVQVILGIVRLPKTVVLMRQEMEKWRKQ